MRKSKDLWDITDKPSTRTKLKILRKCFDIWLTIWNKQGWIDNEWYIMDLFAGRGKYSSDKDTVSGSPLIFLETIASKKKDLEKKNRKINLFLVEQKKRNYKYLKNNIDGFMASNKGLENVVAIIDFKNDCNKIINKIIDSIENTNKHPLFVLIDPSGIQIKESTMEMIVNLKNPKEILLNYMLEGVRRTSGILKKGHRGETLTIKELKTVETLKAFIGKNVNIINVSDRKILEDYVSIFTSQGLKVIGYDMKYPDRDDILYYLLFASRKLSITNIVKDIYGSQKEEDLGSTLFGGKDFYKKEIFSLNSGLGKTERKSLLYRTKVEYGNWTINHVTGCMHGCKFPCYAMMMAKKFGWIKNYEDWRSPKIATNALEILEKEIPKYKDEIDFVHLCFMSDPFMYNSEKEDLIPEIKSLTLNIIERLNAEGIKVTTLTKGIYPDEILDTRKFLQFNEYGITLVSLNKDFKKDFEPFSAPYEKRIESLQKLAKKGLNTWVSMEPYPTPELDNTSANIEKILQGISFVKKIIFGKLNYHRIAYCNGNSVHIWKNNEDFYKEMAKRVIDFCSKNDIKYHIKFGTPLSKRNTINIFKK